MEPTRVVVPKGRSAADGGVGRVYTILGKFACDMAVRTEWWGEFADTILD